MAGILDFLTDASVLNTIGTGVEIGAKIFGARQQMASADEQREAAGFSAEQMRQQAGQFEATSQRDAFFEDRTSKILQSNALAAAAASGGGASDPTVVNIIAGIAQEGGYRKAVSLYQGADRARALRMQAAATELEGDSRRKAGRMGGYTSLFGAGTSLAKGMARDSSMFQRFAAGGPKTPSAPAAVDDWWAYDGEDAY